MRSLAFLLTLTCVSALLFVAGCSGSGSGPATPAAANEDELEAGGDEPAQDPSDPEAGEDEATTADGAGDPPPEEPTWPSEASLPRFSLGGGGHDDDEAGLGGISSGGVSFSGAPPLDDAPAAPIPPDEDWLEDPEEPLGPRPRREVDGAPWEVILRWDRPRDTADLAGYRIYDGPRSGDYDWVTEIGATPTVSLDLAPGQYFIAVTAYDFAGNESELSEEVSIFLPRRR